MAKETHEYRVIGERALLDLFKLADQIHSKVSTASGSLGASIKDAAEKKNLHPASFKLVARLRRMDPIKLRHFLENFDHYREVAKLDDRKASMMDLRAAEAEEGAPKNGSGKAHKNGDGESTEKKPSGEKHASAAE